MPPVQNVVMGESESVMRTKIQSERDSDLVLGKGIVDPYTKAVQDLAGTG